MVPGNFYDINYVTIVKDHLKVRNTILSCINKTQLKNALKLKTFFKEKHKYNLYYNHYNFENIKPSEYKQTKIVLLKDNGKYF